jgi:hypothetical protein
MPELTEAQVRALAGTIDLPLTDADAAEVTHRLNAFIVALEPLTTLSPPGVDAAPVPVDPDLE